jgi:iron complex outermembrane receptor protein
VDITVKIERIKYALLASSALAMCGFEASAQEATSPQTVDTIAGPQQAEPPAAAPDKIVVVGSQIAGAEITGALPVTVVGVEEIAATGAVSSEDLFRTLPAAGDITFNGTFLGGGNANAARGDVSTVSLRGLAQGNTLSLINGRRAVLHPTSQTDNSTPVFGYNTNAIPVAGMERVEVLKDGAAALYGTDAVAGVVNNVLRSDFTGLDIDLQYGFAEGTNLEETTGNILYGTDFLDGRGNISLFVGGTTRTALLNQDQDYTATNDFRNRVAGTPWANTTAFDGRGTGVGWGAFDTVGGPAGISSNGVVFTDAAGIFHTQPAVNSNAAVQGVCDTTITAASPGRNAVLLNNDICFGRGNLSATTLREMRQDTAKVYSGTTTTPSVDRANFFSFVNYDLTDNISLFGEVGYYWAKTEAVLGPSGSLASTPITIAANAYWNPLGPVGSPNRLPGLNIPASGLPVTIQSYTFADAGERLVEVENDQTRLLAGIKGDQWGWSWESAALYSEAVVNDTSELYSSTLVQQAINRTDSTAYNPFSGADPLLLGPDTTPNPDSIIDTFRISNTRENKTTLALADFKVSKPDLFTYWAGEVGIAAGVEYRRETYRDNRDPRQDTSQPYTDSVTGIRYGSDLVSHSPSPDVHGTRNVTSAYAELQIPLVSPDWNIPLVQRVDMQVAGRYEDFSDVGSVTKPKVALSWEVFDSVKLRGSWSEGFKAPNLEVLNTPVLERLSSWRDNAQCEADLRAGRITSFAACTRSYGVPSLRSGNPELEPEESESYSFGGVFTPTFLPEAFGDITLTVDRWHIEQEGIIGIVPDQTAIDLDYYYRQIGQTNPLIVRRDPTPQQVLDFQGTGLPPAGDILYIIGAFQNLNPLLVEGIDYGLQWRVPAGPGDLNVSVNASQNTKYYQNASTEAQTLIDAKAAGIVNAGVPVTGAASLLEQDGRPKWKYSVNATYKVDQWSFGLFTQYTGQYYQATVLSSNNAPWKVSDTYMTNVYVDYDFGDEGLAAGTQFRVGIRNLFDTDPPFATGGYGAALYQPMPRYWYFSAKKSF